MSGQCTIANSVNTKDPELKVAALFAKRNVLKDHSSFSPLNFGCVKKRHAICF
jgi:hypothetical protein